MKRLAQSHNQAIMSFQKISKLGFKNVAQAFQVVQNARLMVRLVTDVLKTAFLLTINDTFNVVTLLISMRGCKSA